MQDYEIIIIGAGPAGLQAAIHTARRKHRVLILGKPEESALWNAHVENYFGFAEKISGADLIKAGLSQALKFGADHHREDVIRLERRENGFLVETESGENYQSLALILAMGVKKKKRIFKEEDKFVGKGVSYCVDCDAWFYRGKRVAVIGDGSAALHGAQTLTKFASKVYFVALREMDLSQVGTEVEIIKQKPIKLLGEEEVRGIGFVDGSEVEVDGVFIELGAKGPLELLAPLGVELDPETFNYVKVNLKMETSLPGVFACGDLTGPPLQVAKAVGEGCVAGLSASEYIKKLLKEPS